MALNGISLGQARPAQARRDLNPFQLYCSFFFSNPATRHTNATSVPSKLNQICVAALPKAFASHTERQTKAKLSTSKRKILENTHTHARTATETVAHTHRQSLIGCCSPLQSFRQGGWLPCTVCARFPQLRWRASPSESEAPAQLGSLRFSSAALASAPLVCARRMRWICVMETHFACTLLIRNVALPHAPLLVEAPKRKLVRYVLYIWGSDKFLDLVAFSLTPFLCLFFFTSAFAH